MAERHLPSLEGLCSTDVSQMSLLQANNIVAEQAILQSHGSNLLLRSADWFMLLLQNFGLMASVEFCDGKLSVHCQDYYIKLFNSAN